MKAFIKTLFVYIAVVVLFLLSLMKLAHGQDAFCTYTQEQAMAQRDILRTPSAVSGFVQPAGIAPELVAGVSLSLSSVKQSGLVMKAATTTCTLEQTTTAVQQKLLYALPSLERDAAIARRRFVQQAEADLEEGEADALELVAVQNLTRPAVYFYRQARVALDLSVKAPVTVPAITSTPLRTLLDAKTTLEQANQTALSKISKQTSWDVAVSAGVHRQVTDFTPTSTETGGYGTFSLTYNLARRAANKHLDKGVSAYIDWKHEQKDDVIQQAAVLKAQMESMVLDYRRQLDVLTTHEDAILKDIDSLKGVDTSNAAQFRSQLRADLIVLSVEVRDVRFRLAETEGFLVDNF
jgi:hypothetical protein